jgi:hypothetical protein
MRTHYEVLGVEADSGAAAIRAAYVALMKRYHPDSPLSRLTGAASSQDDIHQINLAYSILRDRSKRAEYDLRLRQEREQARDSLSAPQRGHPPRRKGPPQRTPPRRPSSPLPRQRASRWRRLSTSHLTSALVGLLLALIMTVDWLSPIDRQLRIAGAAPSIEGTERLQDLPHPQQTLPASSLTRAIELAASLPPAPARLVSMDCFRRAARRSAIASADLCVSFDFAAAFWHEGEFSGLPGEEYFMPETLRARHRGVLTRFLEQADVRDEAIRAATFRALLDYVRRKGSDSAWTTSTPATLESSNAEDFDSVSSNPYPSDPGADAPLE